MRVLKNRSVYVRHHDYDNSWWDYTRNERHGCDKQTSNPARIKDRVLRNRACLIFNRTLINFVEMQCATVRTAGEWQGTGPPEKGPASDKDEGEPPGGKPSFLKMQMETNILQTPNHPKRESDQSQIEQK